MLGMTKIHLTGQLLCNDDAEVTVVSEFLPRHIDLTRAEPGCISFEVHQTTDPRIWDVAECFQDAHSFETHQSRVKASEWGRATSGILRSYSVLGL